jgi:serine/threonine-protein kinase PknK
VMIAGTQGDLPAATKRAAEARVLADQMTDSVARGLAIVSDGYIALLSNDFDRASTCFDAALAASDDPVVRLSAMMLQGWVLQFRGDIGSSLVWQEQALAIAESAGETVFRSILLWSIGVGWWRHGEPERAEQLLRQCLRLTLLIDDPRNGAACLEALAWIAGAKNEQRRAVVLMAAADELGRLIGVSPAVLPDLAVFHEECERRSRAALSSEEYDKARREGSSVRFDDIVRYALGDDPGRDRHPQQSADK